MVSDNLRKGAALNAVQIAEVLVNRKLIQPKWPRIQPREVHFLGSIAPVPGSFSKKVKQLVPSRSTVKQAPSWPS